jgi:excisionase family DNA binding protein
MQLEAMRKVAQRAVLSVKEVCYYLGLGRTTFYKLVRNGDIPAHKCGRRTFVLRDELDEALRSLPRVGRAA